MVSVPEVLTSRETILAIVWFFIGFGAGLALLRLWKIVLIALVAAFLAPLILGLMGISLPVTPENIVDAIVSGIEWFAGLLASRTYGALGFLIGAVLGLVFSLMRSR
jgi:uncharacterized membrane protein (Fun14 family)